MPESKVLRQFAAVSLHLCHKSNKNAFPRN
jgi:hypothetical protein